MRIILLFVLVFTSCNLNTTVEGSVEVENLSDKKIDKFQININSHKYALENLSPRSKTVYRFNKFDVHAQHDVVYSFIGYIADSPVVKQTFFSNDLGFVPDSVSVQITDSLELKYAP